VSTFRPFIGWGNGALLFVTFAALGIGLVLVIDRIMGRYVTPDVRGRAGPTAAVIVGLLAAIYAVLVAFIIVTQYNQLRAANEQVAAKAAALTAMSENSRVFPEAEGRVLRGTVDDYVRSVVDTSFPALARTSKPELISDQKLEQMFRALIAIEPASPAQSAAFSQTLDRLDEVAETKARIVNSAGETIPWPLVLLLALMGITLLVVSSVLDTRHRRSHLLILSALALLVSLTLALVVSLNYPFDGILPINDAPLRRFLEFRSAR
jgi:Protein of unknown function (DUF4239)